MHILCRRHDRDQLCACLRDILIATNNVDSAHSVLQTTQDGLLPSLDLLRLASDMCNLRLRAELREETPWSKRAIF